MDGCGEYDAIQPNGEHLRFEAWTVKAWAEGRMTDPMLKLPLDAAVEIRPAGWPRVTP